MSVGASQLRLDSFSAVFQNGCRFPQRFGKSSWRFALGDFPETPSKRHPDATPRTRLAFPPCTGDRGPPLQGGGHCRPRRRLRNSPAIRTAPAAAPPDAALCSLASPSAPPSSGGTATGNVAPAIRRATVHGQQRAAASGRPPFVACLPSAGRLPDPLLCPACQHGLIVLTFSPLVPETKRLEVLGTV